ncbi:MAG: hypothetical protein KH138_04575 [Firmicutes bacterium]|nr:hypothetical protein [Bacillota bacterium]
MKFIYVFGEDGKSKMLQLGYELVSSNKKNDVYVFLNQDRQNFENLDVKAVFSDMLTF